MTYILPFDLVELEPCPAIPDVSAGGTLREIVYREDAWLPEDIDALCVGFANDEDLPAIADRLGRTLSAVRTKISDLGLRRNSARPWTEMEDEYVVRTYGDEATSAIAATLGRSAAAIYARAKWLNLTEGNAPPYTQWEIAQIRAGYAKGVPVAQLGVLIGRPVGGIAAVASRLEIKHANSPPDWSPMEQQRALELAATGIRYVAIADRLESEGFPRREGRTMGQTLRRLGYNRGWGRPWLAEEDDLIRRAYTLGESLAPLQDALGRSKCSITWRSGELGLRGTHARPNGWRTDPVWSQKEIETLKQDYGRIKTKELAARLGRGKSAIYSKAWSLGLEHGYFRPLTDDERQAIRIARDRGISLTDLAVALHRDLTTISKLAIQMGIPFSQRTMRAPRGPRAGRPVLTLTDILALADNTVGRAADAAANPENDEERIPRLCRTAARVPAYGRTPCVPLPRTGKDAGFGRC